MASTVKKQRVETQAATILHVPFLGNGAIQSVGPLASTNPQPSPDTHLSGDSRLCQVEDTPRHTLLLIPEEVLIVSD